MYRIEYTDIEIDSPSISRIGEKVLIENPDSGKDEKYLVKDVRHIYSNYENSKGPLNYEVLVLLGKV